jgi:3-isopropylmalate/(R)-2-methylmalate dehydratase small subunit
MEGGVQKFTVHTGIPVPLPLANVDTDMIIPAVYLKAVERAGIGKGLFHNLRYTPDGRKVDFVLDDPKYAGASILIGGENFGCGSSREHAPWALLDGGIRVVIAPSFADIFFNNAFKNGMLLIKLPQSDIDKLLDDAARGQNARLTVDLEKQTIAGPDGGTIRFDVDPFRKHCLLNGLDDIGLTMQKGAKIDGFEQQQRAGQPWLYAKA